MQKLVFAAVWLTAFLVESPGCKPRDLSCFEKKPLDKTQLPPNCVRIKENLFADKTEISNIDYREYLYWVEQVYGRNSFTYQQCLPDTLVWRETLSFGEPLVESYFRHPAYDTYPVVGVSYDQAVAFCDWRTDRVYEMTLIRMKRIQPNPAQDSANHFTVQRYRSGQYGAADLSVPVSRFRLPAEAEWELAASGGLDVKQYPQGCDFDSPRMKRMAKKHQYLFHTKEAADSPGGDKKPVEIEGLFSNNFGIYNMIGNVAEMVSERSVAKGGSYMHPASECVIVNKFAYENPTNWLGFRCVCSWENE